MARLDLNAVQDRMEGLGKRDKYSRDFIFDLLEAYGRSKSSISRLRSGSLNIADDPATEVAQKGIVYFKWTDQDLLQVISALSESATVQRYDTRFLIVTDGVNFVAVDRKNGENLAVPLADIDEHFDFFLPWAGMEKTQ